MGVNAKQIRNCCNRCVNELFHVRHPKFFLDRMAVDVPLSGPNPPGQVGLALLGVVSESFWKTLAMIANIVRAKFVIATGAETQITLVTPINHANGC